MYCHFIVYPFCTEIRSLSVNLICILTNIIRFRRQNRSRNSASSVSWNRPSKKSLKQHHGRMVTHFILIQIKQIILQPYLISLTMQMTWNNSYKILFLCKIEPHWVSFFIFCYLKEYSISWFHDFLQWSRWLWMIMVMFGISKPHITQYWNIKATNEL